MTRWATLLVLFFVVVVTYKPEVEAHNSVVLTPTVAPTTEMLDDSDDSVDTADDLDDSDDSGDENQTPAPTTPQLKIGWNVKTVDTIVSTHRNWVGPTIGKPDDSDSACYREAHIMNTCPVGYSYKMKTCWAECPLDYPVECGMECIRQNDDCKLQLFAKVGATVMVPMSLLKMNVFGLFAKLAIGVQRAIKCTRSMLSAVKTISKYIRSLKVNDPQMAQDQILLALYYTSYVTIDLPAAVVVCLGKAYPAILDPISTDMGIVQYLVSEIVAHDDDILQSWERFKAFLVGANFTEAVNELNDTDISSLKTGLASNSTCGYELQRITDRTWRTINEMRDQGIKEDNIRVAIGNSELMLNDIPTVTNNCMEQMIAESDEATAYDTRDKLRKTFSVIVDDLIDSGKSDNGTSIMAKKYTRIAIDKTIRMIALLDIDTTRITSLLSEYIQPICGPTQLIGEIDDGNEPYTLGLTTVKKAFNGSSLTWEKVGDGVVSIKFVSTDTKDVTVNILSGGDKIDEKDVPAGKTATWTSNVTTLGGKTLYLDRWRPGLLGLPGTGGGSLKLWVPQASEGGRLDLTAKLNVS